MTERETMSATTEMTRRESEVFLKSCCGDSSQVEVYLRYSKLIRIYCMQRYRPAHHLDHFRLPFMITIVLVIIHILIALSY